MEIFNVTNQRSISCCKSEEPTTYGNMTEGVTVPSPPAAADRVGLRVVSTLLLGLATAGAVANLLVLLSYKYEKKLRCNFQILVRNQAAADFIVCAVPMSLYAVYVLLGYWPFGRVLCGITLLLDFTGCIASVYALVAICVDRLWATKWCIHYRRFNTSKKVTVMCFVVWLSTAITVWYPVLSDRVLRTRDNECNIRVEENQAFMSAINITVAYAPCAFVVASYSVVYHDIRKLAKTLPEAMHPSPRRHQVMATTQLQSLATALPNEGRLPVWTVKENTEGNSRQNRASLQPAGTNRCGETSRDVQCNHGTSMFGPTMTNENTQTGWTGRDAQTSRTTRKRGGKGSSNKTRKSFITLSYIVLAYMVCYLPLCVTKNVMLVSPELVPAQVYTVMYWMKYLNSALNPFMYAFSSADLRSTVVRMLKLGYCKSPPSV